MATMHDLVFLFDVDNTLLDNDRQARKPAVQIALECIDTITSRRQEMSSLTSQFMLPRLSHARRRRGDEGFGEGNFRALFELIEADQIERGVLVA